MIWVEDAEPIMLGHFSWRSDSWLRSYGQFTVGCVRLWAGGRANRAADWRFAATISTTLELSIVSNFGKIGVIARGSCCSTFHADTTFG